MQDFLINNPVFSNDQNGIPWGVPFFEYFSYSNLFFSMKKRKGFSLHIGYVMIELHVLIREHSGFFTFSLYYFELFTVKINILQAYTSHFYTTRTTTVQQTNEYFVFKQLTMM
jgi:hypothetical protein